MDKSEYKNQKKILHTMNQIFNVCLIGVVIGFAFLDRIFEHGVWGRSMRIILPILTVFAGGISFFNWKLPAKDKIRAKVSISSFGIHPYVTFIALLIYDFLLLAARL